MFGGQGRCFIHVKFFVKILHEKSENSGIFPIFNTYELRYNKDVDLKKSKRRIKEVDFCGPETLRKSQKQNIARRIYHEQKKKFWSMVVCCVMVLAICSPVFATDITVNTDLPTLTDEEMDALREHEHSKVTRADFYPCPNCPAAQCLALYCGAPRAVSHQTSCKNGCIITWYTASYWYQCNLCGYVKPGSKIVGHTCRLDHSVCADEYWCIADVRT